MSNNPLTSPYATYLCDSLEQGNTSSTTISHYNTGVKFIFPEESNSKVDTIIFDFDNLTYDEDATIQNCIVNLATKQGSAKDNVQQGTTLQEDILSYALTSGAYLTHTCNFAASDSLTFENNYINSLNIALTNQEADQNQTIQLTNPSVVYVQPLVKVSVIPNKINYDSLNVNINATFADGNTVGILNTTTL